MRGAPGGPKTASYTLGSGDDKQDRKVVVPIFKDFPLIPILLGVYY